MNLEPVPGGIGNIVGSIVIMALGIVVMVVRERTSAQRWFSVFAIALGLGSGASNVNASDPAWAQTALWGLIAACYAASGLAIVGMVGSYTGRPERAASLGLTLVPLAVSGSLWVTGLLVDPEGIEEPVAASGIIVSSTVAAGTIGFYLFHSLALAGATAFALWAARGTAGQVHQASLMSSGLVLYSAWVAGAWYSLEGVFIAWGTASILFGLLWLVGVWLAIVGRCAAPAAARNAALIPLAAVVAAMAANIDRAPWAFGISRILMAAILAYAIVRHHAFGIDVRLRWGISRSTLAAVFVAVFFIVSEGAQAFFGERLQSEYLGIAAAGALVLGIAPLQRIADRVALAAVPAHVPADAPDHAEAVYLEAFEAARSDGIITSREERHLAKMADLLGLAPDRAFDLRERREAEDGGP